MISRSKCGVKRLIFPLGPPTNFLQPKIGSSNQGFFDSGGIVVAAVLTFGLFVTIFQHAN